MIRPAHNPGSHVPSILSKDAIEDLRLCGLYPNAADLLCTLDFWMDYAGECSRALAELVRLKKLKDERIDTGGYYLYEKEDYDKNKPLAWAAAVAALSIPAAAEASGGCVVCDQGTYCPDHQ